jgi:AcrR family transcriptional regulator
MSSTTYQSKQRRSYHQSARAAATEATRERIVDASFELFLERSYDEVGLRDVAFGAGVALQTVVNHFGTKDAVFLAAVERYSERIRSLRDQVAPDEVAHAAEILAEDYEHHGDANIRALAVEHRFPAIADGLADGRRYHREWVERSFPGALVGLSGAERTRRLMALSAATDVTTWKYLRRDHGLSRARTAAVMQELIEALYPKRRS